MPSKDKILQQVFTNILNMMNNYHKTQWRILLDILFFIFNKIFPLINVINA